MIAKVYPAEAAGLARKQDAYVASLALGAMTSQLAVIDRAIREALAAEHFDEALARSGAPTQPRSVEDRERDLKDGLRLRGRVVASPSDDRTDDDVAPQGAGDEESAKALMLLRVAKNHPKARR